MEFAGDEKRVQALFSELLLEDQSLAPGFENLWTRAEKVGPVRVHASHKSLMVIVSVVIVAGAALLAARSWYVSTPFLPEHAVNVSPQLIVTPSSNVVYQTSPGTSVNPGLKRPERQKRFSRLRPVERTTAHEAALISAWQSPTQIFMNSAVTVSFNSLPQLNQSVEELKLFLSRDTDLTKESNQ